MMIFGFKKNKSVTFDSEKQYAVIRASICTGEKVAGFKNKDGSGFIDVCVIKNDKDLEDFKKTYGVSDIKVEY